MNSEHRHELQQNALANYLGRWLKAIEPYTKLIAVAFAVGAIVLVAYSLVDQSRTMDRSQATLTLLQNSNAGDADALAAIGDQYGKTGAGVLARLYEADTNLTEGINGLYEDREEATGKIESAIRAYKSVAGDKEAASEALRARAQFGLGHAYESLGKIKEATAAYQAAVEQTDVKAVAEAASQRIQMLGKPETKEFLAWFEAQDFKPADPAMPPKLPSGNVLPDLPDLDLPPVEGLKVPDELKGKSDEPAAAAPGEMALPSDKPAEEAAKPAEDSAKPAEDAAKPVEEAAKPVEEPANPTEEADKAAEDAVKPAEDAAKAVEEAATPAEPAPAESPAEPAPAAEQK